MAFNFNDPSLKPSQPRRWTKEEIVTEYTFEIIALILVAFYGYWIAIPYLAEKWMSIWL